MSVFYFPPFKLDLQSGALQRGDTPIALRADSFALLRFLVLHPGHLVTKAALLDSLWREAPHRDSLPESAVDELREALEDDASSPRYIETVRERGYRFIARVSSTMPRTSELAAASPYPVPNLVGRDTELCRLDRAFATALEGSRQTLFVAGEPGIGKTTLVDRFLGSIEKSNAAWIARGQCIEHYGAAEGYMPVFEALTRLCRAPGAEQARELLILHAPTWAVQMPALVTSQKRERLQEDTQGATRQRMLREMADTLAIISETRPLILCFEDLHWSDVSTLELLSVVARGREPARLLTIGIYRPIEVLTGGHALLSIQRELVAHRQCEELALGPLAEADVAGYMARRYEAWQEHSAAREELAHAIHRRTEGNPLFMVNAVDYLLSREALERREPWSAEELLREVPDRIQQLIEKQFDRLTPDEQALLEMASVAGAEFCSEAVASAAERPAEEIEGFFMRLARRAQFITAAGAAEWPDGTVTSRFKFLHVLYADVFYDRVPTARRVGLHRRIAAREESAYGERVDEIAGELAHHFMRCYDKRGAIRYLRLSGEQALGREAYEEAIVQLTKALGVLEDPDTPTEEHQPDSADRLLRCELLLLIGNAQNKASRPLEAEAAIMRAADIALEAGSTELLVRAASVLVSLTIFYGYSPGPSVRILDQALHAMSPGDSPLRAKILASLASALGSSGADGRAAIYAGQAVEIARKIGDPPLLADALVGLYFSRYARGEATLERLSIARELLDLCASTKWNPSTSSFAHWALGLTHLQLGNVVQADAAFEGLSRNLPVSIYLSIVYESTRALMEGRFDDAERLAERTLAMGEGFQRTENAAGVYGLQMFTLRRLQGRLSEIEPVVRTFTQRETSSAVWLPGLAVICSELGRSLEARDAFDRLARHNFSTVARDSMWLGSMIYLAETCAFLGDKRRAAILYQALLPWAEYNAVVGAGMSACQGAVSHYVGMLAATLGNLEDAERHFEYALEMNARMNARPWLANTQFRFGKLLLEGRRASDQIKALSLLNMADATARELGMRALEDSVARLITPPSAEPNAGTHDEAERLKFAPTASVRQSNWAERPVSVDTPSTRDPHPVETLSRHQLATVEREGEYWTVAYAGRTSRMKDAKGLNYIAYLLAHPDQKIRAIDLTAVIGGSPLLEASAAEDYARSATLARDLGDAGEALDARAKASYQRRLNELREELEEAREFGNERRAERAQAEVEALAHELKRAIGLGGRHRRAASSNERARTAVTRAIRLALAKIADRNPALGKLLSTTIRTGTVCSYVPDDRFPVSWKL